jgi:hypothetical protein
MTELIVALASLALALSNYQVKAAELPAFDVWLQDLAQCESKNNPNAVNPHDPITRSRGLYQYKDVTFINAAKQFSFFPDSWTDKQILEQIFDGHTQTVMTRNLINDNYENWRKWTNCVLGNKKLGIEAIGKPPIPLK